MPQQSGTECFTMSGTMMDNKPLSPSSAEPEAPVAADDAKPAASSLSPASLLATGARRESALRDVFLGREGVYPGTRWLIYIAMAWITFQVEGWLVMSLRSHLNVLWRRLIIEAIMMLAAILPGFVMARIENRPFGDFGLPARPAFGRNFWVGAGLIGFFLCLTLRRTGDLWWAVGFHMAWDWGESYLYSVPDSGAILPGHLLNSSLHGPDWLTGGSVGPEGSYLVFVVIGALWVLFDRAYPEVKYGANHSRTLSSS